MTITPTVRVEFNLASPNTGTYLHIGDATRGLIGTGTLGPAGGLWTDISPYVRSLTVDRGSRRVDGPIVRYEAGSCSVVLDNSDRRFDPTNLSGPYVSAGATQLTPMRGVRIIADFAGVSYNLFRGYADAWQVTYQQPFYSEVTLTATDGFKVLGNVDRAASSAVGAGEDTGARISRILNSVDWPTSDRIIATGDTTVQATTLEGDALAELQLTADTEWGEFYIDGAGRAFFRNRTAIYEDTRSNTSQATFGDNPGELEYDDVVPEYDDTMIFNHIRVTRVGGTEQTTSDTTSQINYLTHTFERSDLLMQTDAAALAYAQHVLFTSKEPELRFASMVVDPQGDTAFEAAAYPQVLGRVIGDRITVIRRPPGGGSPIQRDVFIRGITHNVDAVSNTWKTVWTLQDAPESSPLIIGHATRGLVGTGTVTF